MLYIMNSLRRALPKLFALFITILVASCGQLAPVPTSTAGISPSPIPITPLPTHTSIPSPTNTPTATPEPDIALDCKISDEAGQLYLLNDQEFRNLRTSDGKLDRALAVHYPEWANYTQMVPWSTQPVKLGEIIVSASLDVELNLQINPAVTLVTLGESLDWQLPANTDLFSKSREISLTLQQHDYDWTNPQNESLRSQYPEIANSGTYALYAFFNYDLGNLQGWCNTYQQLFGNSP